MIKEEQLIARCRAGDPTAYTMLYNQHAAAVYSSILRLTGHTAEAEDILQDSFVAAFEGIAGYIYSAYNSYTYQLTSWTIKVGVRLEQTHVDADFVTNSSKLNQNYTNLVPSVSIQRRLKNNQSLTFGFTNRLQRPGIWQLNPFVDRTNPQIFSTGNPDLQPVTSNLLELNYAKSGRIRSILKPVIFTQAARYRTLPGCWPTL